MPPDTRAALAQRAESEANDLEDVARRFRVDHGENVGSLVCSVAADTLRELAAANAALAKERDEARGYLIRNVIEPLHPACVPLPDLLGVCTQIDNITAGLAQERDAATRLAEQMRADLDALREALEKIAEPAMRGVTTVFPNRAPCMTPTRCSP